MGNLTGRNSCENRVPMCQRMYSRLVFAITAELAVPRFRTPACSKLCGERCMAICAAVLWLSARTEP